MTHMHSAIYEIRFHGRGGQGVVSAAAVLALAVFENGYETQAFPKFGSERRGAPVEAYVRIAQRPIRTHTQIYTPDVVIIQDATLMHCASVFDGLKPGGNIILNSAGTIKTQLLNHEAYQCLTIAANDIAQKHLSRPLPNMVLLGAFAAISDYASINTLKTAIAGHLQSKGKKIVQSNVDAMMEGYETAINGIGT